MSVLWARIVGEVLRTLPCNSSNQCRRKQQHGHLKAVNFGMERKMRVWKAKL